MSLPWRPANRTQMAPDIFTAPLVIPVLPPARQEENSERYGTNPAGKQVLIPVSRLELLGSVLVGVSQGLGADVPYLLSRF